MSAPARDRDRKADLDAYVAQLVAQAPPLSPEQIDKIASLLRPVGKGTT